MAYGFIPDYGDAVPDPHNPRIIQGTSGEVSWFAMPAWREPDYLDPADEARRGKVETVEWQSQVFEGNTRKAEVYLPAGYDADLGSSFPTVYLFGGEETVDPLAVRSALDHRIGVTVRPLVAVSLLPDRQTDRGPGSREKLAEVLATELVPLIDETYRTVADPMARAVAGAGGAGDLALVTAFLRPETFGRVGSLWPIAFQDLGEVPVAERHPLVIFHTWGTYHLRAPHEGWDQVISNRELWQELREAGHRPTGGEVPEGFGMEIWRAHTAEMLAALFPMPRSPG